MAFIKFFATISAADVPAVGGKNASLGEMIQQLTPKGINIPNGFAITADAYWHHLETNGLKDKITHLLAQLDKKNLPALAQIGLQIRTLIAQALLPEDLNREIIAAYQLLEKEYGTNCDVAVRSSATAEDLPEASFAGQQETFLNIRGTEQLLASCTKCFASLFTDRAISYRIDHGFDHLSVALSIGVQKMIRSDKTSSGVIFTLDTETGFKDVIFITSSYGLGEPIVQGQVDPDEFYIHKPTLQAGYKPLLKKRIGSKKIKLVYAEQESSATQEVSTPVDEQRHFSISDDEALNLAQQALMIEEHYSTINNRWTPMDIEWAKDGIDGKLYIVQARPETVHAHMQQASVIEEYALTSTPSTAAILAQGKSVGRKIATGKARIINSIAQMNELREGEILVTEMTDPDWEPIMKIAAGIITNRGGRTCHAAIVSRELGIPAIVGTSDATKKIASGELITMDCSSSEVGSVYRGAIPFSLKRVNISHLGKPPVNIMVNVGNPDQAFRTAQLPVDGVGLARLEFIINTSIQIHPMALVHPEKIPSTQDQASIAQLTADYDDKAQFFIDKLAQEAGTIAAAFYPRPVIIRMSDFKTNEYRQLIGGRDFEPQEENPMLGFRGASRYYHPAYQEAFALECKAIKKMREEMGLTNAIPMLPFVRTIDEARRALQAMATHGLERGSNDLKIYMMVEIPSNVLLIDQFSQLFDGFSIGSNDLTQLVLGIDRDSALIAPLFDERNEAVKMMLALAIQGARAHNKPIGICGQAPSDYPELADYLIKTGISSLSLNPDAVLHELVLLNEK